MIQSELCGDVQINKLYNLENYKGYKTNIMKDRFRAISVLKNRDGEAEKVVGAKFLGEIGLFNELPIPSLLLQEDYEKLLKI